MNVPTVMRCKMKTQTDKQTASAPETRTPQERLRHHVTGAIERGEAQPIIEQRTLPAEKPTGASWSQIRCEELSQWFDNACAERDKAWAHAAQLAEALRECLHSMPLNTKNPVLRQIKTIAWQKITAYESEMRQ